MGTWIDEAKGYPRPDFYRSGTMLLDGEWDFSYDWMNVGKLAGWQKKKSWTKKILAPFCVESELSGIGAKLPPHVVWYRRVFFAPDEFTSGKRAILHFGAVDYEAEVWLNGKYLGSHVGGYTPFKFDVTENLKFKRNDLVVRVRDSIDPGIPRGKQSFLGLPFSIFYTTVTGIWQSVWLEITGRAYINNMKASADPSTGNVEVRCDIVGDDGEYRLACVADGPDGSQHMSETHFVVKDGCSHNVLVELSVDEPSLWSVDEPALYSLKLDLDTAKLEIVDTVNSYFAFRKIEIENGIIKMNGEPLYQKLLLNQGYFPGGHYTPGGWGVFRSDIEQAKEMGFNGVRMHMKIENPKFLFQADSLGFLVWEEMPAAFMWSERMRVALRKQLEEAIARDSAHPSIIVWLLFCESWGVNNLVYSEAAREFVREMVGMARALDPTRLIVDNSGFEHVETDILDIHHYLGTVEKSREFYKSLEDPENMEFSFGNVLKRMKPADDPACPLAPDAAYQGEPIIISEYGGFGFYKTVDRPLLDNFRDYTIEIAGNGLFQGYCYTQQYDTEQEKNGLLNFDRTPKIPLEDVRAVNDEADRLISGRLQNEDD